MDIDYNSGMNRLLLVLLFLGNALIAHAAPPPQPLCAIEAVIREVTIQSLIIKIESILSTYEEASDPSITCESSYAGRVLEVATSTSLNFSMQAHIRTTIQFRKDNNRGWYQLTNERLIETLPQKPFSHSLYLLFGIGGALAVGILLYTAIRRF